jgi:hypothetical protein
MPLTRSLSTMCKPVLLVPSTAITVQDQIPISAPLAIPTSIFLLLLHVLTAILVVILAQLAALIVQVAKVLSPIS